MKELNGNLWKALTTESTVNLVRRIVQDSNSLALRVFLETRRLFHLKDEPPLLLSEFLMKLRDRMAPPECFDIDEDKLADCAYDLTLSKYMSFPSGPNTREIDCRNYYSAFLCLIRRAIEKEQIIDQLQEESYAGNLLQKLVYKNWLRSKLDCRRKTLFSKRYIWEVKGVRLYLWYPSYMTAADFRNWIEENFKDIDLSDPKDEQRRIQSIIDKTFGRGHHVSLDGPALEINLSVKEGYSAIEFFDGLVFVGSLAEAVGKEKVKNINELRPAIRKLGEEKVERLILQIFSDLMKNDFNAGKIAKKYGLSKSTVSRFAGSKWVEKIGDTDAVIIPGLWRNTAKILVGNPAFMEAVLTSGFACKLKEILAYIKKQEGKKNER